MCSKQSTAMLFTEDKVIWIFVSEEFCNYVFFFTYIKAIFSLSNSNYSITDYIVAMQEFYCQLNNKNKDCMDARLMDN